MKKLLVTTAAIAALAIPSAAFAGPGKTIQDACGLSFGQIIAAQGFNGQRDHQNYAGGAKAFSNPVVLAVHGCSAS